MLHHDRILFEQLILRASDSLGIEAGIVEKDYYVTLFLKGIAEKQPDIIFKGGTSLSKCYKLIERFSEDVDLNLECEARPTQGQRILLKSNILSVIESMGLNLSNPDEIRSRRDYNRYVVDYPVVSGTAYLKPQLIVETAVYIRAYPSRRMPASSFIYDYLAQTDRFDLINAYDLAPFELNVQSSERTFIDKLYALGDYYLDNKVTEHSRHIYDLYKLSSVVEINENLRLLAKNVAADRKPHRTCLSVQDGVDMHQLLQEIIDKDAYKRDYETITAALLFEKVNYRTAIAALQKIVDSELFD